MGVGVASGCAGETTQALPRFDIQGTIMHEYQGITELADISSAIIVATPTGKLTSKPLPPVPGSEGTPAPVQYVLMKVDAVISGALADVRTDGLIEVVSPGTDLNTGRLAMQQGGPYLLFVTPAMLAPGNAFGGYVVSGGPNGVFVRTDSRTPDSYYSAYHEHNKTLPEVLTVGRSTIPPITHSEAELIKIGPQ